jgi:hypothetical protein
MITSFHKEGRFELIQLAYRRHFSFKEALATKEPCKFAVNKRQNTNYSWLPVTSKVSCIRRNRGQIKCLQGNTKSIVIFVLKRRKVVRQAV